MDKTKTVLVLDDCSSFRAFAKKIFNNRGFKVIQEKSPIQAISQLGHNSDIDFVLVDVDLNYHITGFDVIRLLRKFKVGMALISSTSAELPEDLKDITYLKKGEPFPEDLLL